MVVNAEPASPQDVPEIVRAYEWLAAPPGRAPSHWDPGLAAAAVQRALTNPDARVFVVHQDRTLVGFCTVYRDIESVRFGPRAWIEDLAVHPDLRSRGIGHVLLAAAKEWAKSHGATHVALESGEARVDAHRFYEREQPSGRSKCFSWKL